MPPSCCSVSQSREAGLSDMAILPSRLEDAGRPYPDRAGLFGRIERSITAALETYANVHRGSGHASLVSTELFEHTREIVLDHLGLDPGRYVVVFGSAESARRLVSGLAPGTYRSISGHAFGLSVGVTAVAALKDALRSAAPSQTGGGTVKLVSTGGAVWAGPPERFEAGTPALINLIAFAAALLALRDGSPLHTQAGVRRPLRPLTASEILRDDLEGYAGRELLTRLRQTMPGRNLLVPTDAGLRRFINFDNAASTPPFRPVAEVFLRTLLHPEADEDLVRGARAACARFLGAPPDVYDIIFTSNTTEAINIAADSLGREGHPGIEPVVLNSLVEHNSNELPWRSVPGVTLVKFETDKEGFVDLGQLESLLREYNSERRHGKRRVALVAVSGASNVLGTFNDLTAISGIVHRYGARLLVDGAQVVAHRRVDMGRTGIDYLAFSGHKAYAPFGSGALIVRNGLLTYSPAEIRRLRESGEENAAGIAALGKALQLLERVGMELVEAEERRLTSRVLRGLNRIPGIEIYGIHTPDSPRFVRKGGIVTFRVRHVPHNLVAQELAEGGGIGVRSGCFCAHLLVQNLLRIHPLRVRAAGVSLRIFPALTARVLPGLVRISVGLENGTPDVEAALRTLGRIVRRKRGFFCRLLAASDNGAPFLPATRTRRLMSAFAQTSLRRVFCENTPHRTPLDRPFDAGAAMAPVPKALPALRRRCCCQGSG